MIRNQHKVIYIIRLFTLLFLMSASGCSNINFASDEEVTELLLNNVLYLDGDVKFNTDGTFILIPASQNDPTRMYNGKWFLGDCKDCDSDYPEREITLVFTNRGWVTDDYTFNGSNFEGYGTRLHGWIMKSVGEWNIEFDDNSPSGWVHTLGEGTKLNTKTTFMRKLEKR